VAGLRGFASADEHDRAVIDGWNKLVRPEDRVHLAGDLGMGPEEAILERAGELNGLYALYAGNHDAVHPMHRGSTRPSRQAAWARLFPGGVHLFGQRNISGQRVMISHLPYEGDHSENDRFPQWRPRDYGLPLACGHVHAKWKVRDRQVNVGLDVWDLRPVAEPQLLRVIRGDRSGGVAAGAAGS
jgi:calcineurin-like phosphoesterase family protein